MLRAHREVTDGFNVNCTDPLGRTALTISIENESYEMIEVLLEHGVNVSDGISTIFDYIGISITLQHRNAETVQKTPRISRFREASQSNHITLCLSQSK